MSQLSRISNYSSLTLLLIICVAWSIRPTFGYGDDINAQIDADLFLEDDAGGSGDGRGPGFGDIDNGSGCSVDDEDFEDCRAKQHGKSGPVPGVGPGSTGSADKPPRLNDEKLEPSNSNPNNPAVYDPKHEVTGSFFSQPGILAAIICGAIVGLLCAILLVMFIVYRMRKKDEGSYVLEDSKRTTTTYGKTKEFYA